MVRTTPPRPMDITAIFPELAPMARAATRLHPYRASPTSWESSIGGPLLWPADEPWPACPEHDGATLIGLPLVNVRAARDLLAARAARGSGEEFVSFTPEERDAYQRLKGRVELRPSEPILMLPVAQLRRDDVPALPWPQGADLLQVLWCPFDHDDYQFRTALRWRDRSTVDVPLDPAPRPDLVGSEDYFVETCAIQPEGGVIEYPAVMGLPHTLRDRILEWEQPGGVYQGELSQTNGWRAGGCVYWGLTDPRPLPCTICGADPQALLSISAPEWYGADDSWRPIEETVEPSQTYPKRADPTEVVIVRGYTLQILVCGADSRHPHQQQYQ